MLKIKGERVSPREIESIINRHVNVVDSAVIGLDDPVKGKYIRAFVILISSEKNKEIETVLTEYCQLNLESLNYYEFSRIIIEFALAQITDIANVSYCLKSPVPLF